MRFASRHGEERSDEAISHLREIAAAHCVGLAMTVGRGVGLAMTVWGVLAWASR